MIATTRTKKAGREFVGVGVGALVFNDEGKVFLAQRGPLASNEQGAWGEPGGEVEFGEPLVQAITREYLEEFNMLIRPVCQLAAFDHLLEENGLEHWVSVAFVAVFVSGVPRIMEPDKCCGFGWFSLDDLPGPLTTISASHLQAYQISKATYLPVVYR